MHQGQHLGQHVGEHTGSLGAGTPIVDALPKGVRLVRDASYVVVASPPTVLLLRNAISVTITEVTHG